MPLPLPLPSLSPSPLLSLSFAGPAHVRPPAGIGPSRSVPPAPHRRAGGTLRGVARSRRCDAVTQRCCAKRPLHGHRAIPADRRRLRRGLRIAGRGSRSSGPSGLFRAGPARRIGERGGLGVPLDRPLASSVVVPAAVFSIGRLRTRGCRARQTDTERDTERGELDRSRRRDLG
ncbi:hypothetical protein [Burkholderia pseudomallei]